MLTLSVDKDIKNNAKKMRINLSSFLEILLIDHLSEKGKYSCREYVFIFYCSIQISFKMQGKGFHQEFTGITLIDNYYTCWN